MVVTSSNSPMNDVIEPSKSLISESGTSPWLFRLSRPITAWYLAWILENSGGSGGRCGLVARRAARGVLLFLHRPVETALTKRRKCQSLERRKALEEPWILAEQLYHSPGGSRPDTLTTNRRSVEYGWSAN